MAIDKKGFLMYADWITIIQQLPDEKAGQLFKIIFQYVNDQNPVIDDILLSVAFEPMKLQLKRDLKKYEAERSKRSEAGKKGGVSSGISRRNKAVLQLGSKIEANEGDNVNVTDNVTDTVINNNDFASQETEVVTPLQTPVLEKKEVPAGPDGWRQFPGESELDLELPELKAGAVKELIGLGKGFKITNDQLQSLWRVFKISNFNGQKFYQSESDVFTHFVNWTKFQQLADIKAKINTPSSGQSVEELRRQQHEQHLKKMDQQWSQNGKQ